MASFGMRVYNTVPFVRPLFASAQGFLLKTRRYGRDADAAAADAIERETWPTSKWRAWQEEQLAQVLHCAATRVPYYRQMWSERRGRGDNSSWEILQNWPILDKET